MPRRRVLIRAAWCALWLALFLAPRVASARAPCVVDVIFGLDADERDALRPVACAPTPNEELDPDASARLDPILRKLVSMGGWPVAVALRVAERLDPVIRWVLWRPTRVSITPMRYRCVSIS